MIVIDVDDKPTAGRASSRFSSAPSPAFRARDAVVSAHAALADDGLLVMNVLNGAEPDGEATRALHRECADVFQCAAAVLSIDDNRVVAVRATKPPVSSRGDGATVAAAYLRHRAEVRGCDAEEHPTRRGLCCDLRRAPDTVTTVTVALGDDAQ